LETLHDDIFEVNAIREGIILILECESPSRHAAIVASGLDDLAHYRIDRSVIWISGLERFELTIREQDPPSGDAAFRP
jgi:hypothetical protein